MKYSYVVSLSFLSLLALPIITSCGGNSSSPPNKHTERSNTFLKANVSVLPTKDFQLPTNKFKLMGIYSNCAGKLEGEEWFHSKDTSSLILMKVDKDNIDNKDCKLSITGFSFEENGNTFEYKYINENNKEIKGHLLVENFSDLDSIKSSFKIEGVFTDLQKKDKNLNEFIYADAKIDPVDFSRDPTITIVLSEMKIFDSNEIAGLDLVKIDKHEIYSENEIKLNLKQIPAPDYSINPSEKLKIIYDVSSRVVLYSGKILFTKNKTLGNKYVIAPNEDLESPISYQKVHALFKNTDNVFNTVDSIAISGAQLQKLAKLPHKLESKQVTKAYVIFQNENSDLNLSSYQIYTITIEMKDEKKKSN
ncbi:hypothetical protein [Silvanigrella aquatica]|uniref:Lipoprotein n=1 Tax=Silvanigrella aquatica TaxID=1915309 RepID=A0A1L4D3W4_9BACT|nr:hypothetical protein [Silvanigrella aquatica]APJ04906.1 hypothetical protein AXG55_13790 [Silvanigrella aquatica]